MPIKPCKVNNKAGYRWGESGKCYTGKRGKAKAGKQAAAIYASGYKKNPRGTTFDTITTK